MKNQLALWCFCGMIFVSCTSTNPLQKLMVEDWETTYLKIEMPSYLNSDSTYVFEDDFKNDPQRIAQSSYRDDGTFSAWFLNKAGEKVDETSGEWKAKGDSLHVSFEYGGRHISVAYHIQKTEEGFQGTSLFDWDEDGAFDDLLVMKTKRIQNH